MAECPFLSQPLRSVALSLLLEVSKQCRQTLQGDSNIALGTVFRYIGRYSTVDGRYKDDPVYDTEPVTFMSAPFLTLSKDTTGLPGSVELLDFFYGYQFVTGGHKTPRKHRLIHPEESDPRVWRVSPLWSLVIGSGISIHRSSHPMSANGLEAYLSRLATFLAKTLEHTKSFSIRSRWAQGLVCLP